MNYYQARERKDGGGWHFTCRNGSSIWAVGYCATHEPHPTRKEAEECYKSYLLDHRLDLDATMGGGVHKPCEVCKELTNKMALIDETAHALCDQHRTKEQVSALIQAPGFIMSSW